MLKSLFAYQSNEMSHSLSHLSGVSTLLMLSCCIVQVVGNCVAQNNHRFFVALLIFGQLGCLLLTAGASWKLKHMGFPM